MTVDGLASKPRTWTWDEAHALPQSEYAGDIHCVTTWSCSAPASAGSASTSCLGGRPARGRRRAQCWRPDHRLHHQPAARRLHRGAAWVAWTHEAPPLPREHGGPVRLLVPHLYFSNDQ